MEVQAVASKPVFKDEGDSMSMEYSAGVDSDKDGIASVEFGAFIRVKKSEAMDEAIQKIKNNPSSPEWLKKLVGG